MIQATKSITFQKRIATIKHLLRRFKVFPQTPWTLAGKAPLSLVPFRMGYPIHSRFYSSDNQFLRFIVKGSLSLQDFHMIRDASTPNLAHWVVRRDVSPELHELTTLHPIYSSLRPSLMLPFEMICI